jgi:hypothetical protein
MWTPKRIVLLAVGFLMFTLAYIVYSATSLGRINTLPPLPEQYQAGAGNTEPVLKQRKTGATLLERKMEKAFGIGCKELKWPVLLELNSKSMVMAAGMFEVVEDGRMKLEPMSLAVFGKKKNDGRDVEINTLKCKQAYITFDRPVTSMSPSELSGRKIVKSEFIGDIMIVNNRRTAQRDDDLTVDIRTGPLYYDEKNQFIWTNDVVHLKDGQLIPPKADIVAKCMEMTLATSSPPPKPGTVLVHKPKNESISGVKRIVLKQDVTMHLYSSGQSPFPGGDKTPSASPAKDKKGAVVAKPPPDLSHVIIRTPGRFQYDLYKDHDMAHFDVPEDQDQPNTPQDVTVERINERAKTHDQLICKHLELRLKRREGEAPPAKGAPAQTTEQGLEIETAHATGPEVTLTSDAEKLDAHGNDFFYDAGKKRTVMKGVPFMEANKDESLIQAPEMQIQDIPLPVPPGSPPKMYQQITAKGKGSIHLPKKVGDKTVHSTHAYWNEKLVSTRDGALDLLILVGDARFEDEEQGQSLKAETLKVWLLAEEPKGTVKAPTPVKPTPTKTATATKAVVAAPAAPAPSRKPQRVEALRNVVANSPTLKVHDTSRMIVLFVDVDVSKMPAPASAKPAAKPATTPSKPAGTVPPRPSGTQPATGKPAPAQGKPPVAVVKVEPEPPRPIDLSARSIEAKVLRCGERTALDHLWAEGGSKDNKGGVTVHQDPAKAGDGGIHIEGNTLDMKCHPEGNLLVVTGDLAQLEMDKILILGPEVNIDQAANKAWVIGEGAMRMQSNTTLEGKPLGRTVPLTVHWSEDMLFMGPFAEFRGGIQAEQEQARLACQHLQVFFDRPISLKEGARSDQPAKVRSLVGDKEVRVEDKVIERNKLVKYQLLEGRWIAMNAVAREDVPPANKNNEANEVRLSGPGSVRIFQLGGADVATPPGKTGAGKSIAPATDDQKMKLTYVSFHRSMKASSRTNTAVFWEAVRVLTMPCDDPHQQIDLDYMLAQELPEGAMYMRCNQLKVQTVEVRGKSHQEMAANGQIAVQSKDFWATADKMTYNEAKDMIVLEGEGNHLATWTKIENKGGRGTGLSGKKIFLIKSTGKAWVDGGETLHGGGGE